MNPINPQLTKAQLRRKLLKQRQSLSDQMWKEKSDRLVQNLQSFSLFQQAKTILAYFAFRREPDLSALFTSVRHWGFSRCLNRSLVWHYWSPGDRLSVGNYGILEPFADTPMVEPTAVDLILVPAVACDRRGYRLGYGGGFYDRLLSSLNWQQIPTVGIIFNFAFLSDLPSDPWDIPLNAICTETGIWLKE